MIPKTLAEQVASADAIVEGDVVAIEYRNLKEDNFPLTQVRIQVKSLLQGDVPEQKLTLTLPGGYVDGQRLDFGLPALAVGDHVLVLGDAVTDTEVQMVNGPRSIFVQVKGSVGEIAADFDRNPLVDPGCTADRLIARPLDQSPAGEVKGGEDGLPGITPPDRLFTQDPSALGLSWDAFVEAVGICVKENPRKDGLTAVGGGW